jgi:hypothetical protein
VFTTTNTAVWDSKGRASWPQSLDTGTRKFLPEEATYAVFAPDGRYLLLVQTREGDDSFFFDEATLDGPSAREPSQAGPASVRRKTAGASLTGWAASPPRACGHGAKTANGSALRPTRKNGPGSTLHERSSRPSTLRFLLQDRRLEVRSSHVFRRIFVTASLSVSRGMESQQHATRSRRASGSSWRWQRPRPSRLMIPP